MTGLRGGRLVYGLQYLPVLVLGPGLDKARDFLARFLIEETGLGHAIENDHGALNWA